MPMVLARGMRYGGNLRFEWKVDCHTNVFTMVLVIMRSHFWTETKRFSFFSLWTVCRLSELFAFGMIRPHHHWKITYLDFVWELF
jgi:hypothetical protein